MRIVVCVKQVPEVSELTLDPETRRLVREGVPTLINPFDRRAVLEATRLRSEAGSGTITVISMGPPQAESALRECLGLGVDRAVLLCDAGFAGADTLATARALADAIRRIGFDLVLAGRYSIDSETGQVGPEMAALLEVPLLSGVRRLAIEHSVPGAWRTSAECEGDDGFSEIEATLPAVVTCTDRWKSRIPRVLPDDAAAQSDRLEIWRVPDLDGPAERYGSAGSPTWVAGVEPVEVVRERRVVAIEESLDSALDLALAVVREASESKDRADRRPTPRHRARRGATDAIWVIGEREQSGALRAVTHELLHAADALAADLGSGVTAILLEPPLAQDEPPREQRGDARLRSPLGSERWAPIG